MARRVAGMSGPPRHMIRPTPPPHTHLSAGLLRRPAVQMGRNLSVGGYMIRLEDRRPEALSIRNSLKRATSCMERREEGVIIRGGGGRK